MTNPTNGRKTANVALWIAQALLAALFLFAGSMKLAMPVEVLTAQLPVPGAFLKFIGLAEALGALGLILPGLLRIRTELTPLAATGLVIIMNGAAGVTMASGNAAQAIGPLMIGMLLATIAYSRARLVPHGTTARVGVAPLASMINGQCRAAH